MSKDIHHYITPIPFVPIPPYDGHPHPFPHRHEAPRNHSARFRPMMLHPHIPHHFNFWCNKVIPLAYDDSLSYYEVLAKVADYLNNMLNDEKMMMINIEELAQAFCELQGFVNDYFAFYQSKGIINFEAAITNDNYLEILPDVDNAQMNTVYRMQFVEGSTQNVPANLPESAKPYNHEAVLFNLSNFVVKRVGNEWLEVTDDNKEYSTKGNYQLFITGKDIYFRENNGDTWGEWNSIFGNWWEEKFEEVKDYVEALLDDLWAAIRAEVARATAAEQALDTKIEAETSRATAAEQAETDRATAAENALSQRLVAEYERAAAKEAELEQAIEDETDRAEQVEGNLQTAIQTETTRATNAEATIRTDLNAEITRATARESEISGAVADVARNLSEEIVDRQQADENLQDNIDSVDNRLTAAIADERTRAENAEQDIRERYIPNAGNSIASALNIQRSGNIELSTETRATIGGGTGGKLATLHTDNPTTYLVSVIEDVMYTYFGEHFTGIRYDWWWNYYSSFDFTARPYISILLIEVAGVKSLYFVPCANEYMGAPMVEEATIWRDTTLYSSCYRWSSSEPASQGRLAEIPKAAEFVSQFVYGATAVPVDRVVWDNNDIYLKADVTGKVYYVNGTNTTEATANDEVARKGDLTTFVTQSDIADFMPNDGNALYQRMFALGRSNITMNGGGEGLTDHGDITLTSTRAEISHLGGGYFAADGTNHRLEITQINGNSTLGSSIKLVGNNAYLYRTTAETGTASETSDYELIRRSDIVGLAPSSALQGYIPNAGNVLSDTTLRLVREEFAFSTDNKDNTPRFEMNGDGIKMTSDSDNTFIDMGVSNNVDDIEIHAEDGAVKFVTDNIMLQAADTDVTIGGDTDIKIYAGNKNNLTLESTNVTELKSTDSITIWAPDSNTKALEFGTDCDTFFFAHYATLNVHAHANNPIAEWNNFANRILADNGAVTHFKFDVENYSIEIAETTNITNNDDTDFDNVLRFKNCTFNFTNGNAVLFVEGVHAEFENCRFVAPNYVNNRVTVNDNGVVYAIFKNCTFENIDVDCSIDDGDDIFIMENCYCSNTLFLEPVFNPITPIKIMNSYFDSESMTVPTGETTINALVAGCRFATGTQLSEIRHHWNNTNVGD